MIPTGTILWLCYSVYNRNWVTIDRLVVLHRPRGSVVERTLGTAVVTGIRHARGTFVCVMDADGQHPPEVIPRMLAMAQQTNADYVGGSRYLPGGSPEGLDGISREVISRGLALLTRLAFLCTPIRSVTDPLSGFFLFRRSLVTGVELKPVGWKISLEVLVRSRAQRLVEVAYMFASRADGESKASLQQGLLVLRHMLVLLLSLAGVQRFVLFGLAGVSGVLVNTGSLPGLRTLGSCCRAERSHPDRDFVLTTPYRLKRCYAAMSILLALSSFAHPARGGDGRLRCILR